MMMMIISVIITTRHNMCYYYLIIIHHPTSSAYGSSPDYTELKPSEADGILSHSMSCIVVL